MDIATWSLPIVLNKLMQTEFSDFKTARKCLTGSIILQCGLSAGMYVNFSVAE